MKKILYYGSSNLQYQQMPEVDEGIRRLFEKVGVEVVTPPNEKYCVEGLYTFGFRDMALKEAREFYETVKDMDVDAVVSPYAASQYMWEMVYPNEFGMKLPFPFYNVTQFFYHALKDQTVEFKPLELKLLVHDGCTLGRKMKITKEPRAVLEKIPGLQLIEMHHPSVGIDGTTPADWSTCPGSWLNITVPELAEEVEMNFVKKDVMPLEPDAITTDCANAYFGIRMSIMKGNFPVKAYYFTDILNLVWRD